MTIAKNKERFKITLRKDTIAALRKKAEANDVTVSEMIQEVLDNKYWEEIFEAFPLR